MIYYVCIEKIILSCTKYCCGPPDPWRVCASPFCSRGSHAIQTHSQILFKQRKKKKKASSSNNKDCMGMYKERDLVSSIKEAAMRTQNSSWANSSSSREGQCDHLGSLLVAASPFLASLPETVVSRSSFPPLQQHRLQ